MKIILIDPGRGINDELERVSKETGYTFPELYNAWKKTHTDETVPVKTLDLVIEHIEPKMDNSISFDKKISYQEQQRRLPKFLR